MRTKTRMESHPHQHRTKMKVLPLADIVFDNSIYPREKPFWGTICRYSDEMKAGAKFPPITVGFLNGKYVLVDGKHRIEAYKTNQETHVSAHVLYGMNKEQLFVEAVRLNVINGQPLSQFDKVKIIRKLEEMHYETIEISKIVQVSMDTIEQFVARRITVTRAGEPMVLKSALKHMAVLQTPIEEGQQDTISVRSELSLVKQLIQIFENRLYRHDIEFIGAITELKDLVDKFLDSGQTRKMVKLEKIKQTKLEKKREKKIRKKKHK
jgi:hypothetical protein